MSIFSLLHLCQSPKHVHHEILIEEAVTQTTLACVQQLAGALSLAAETLAGLPCEDDGGLREADLDNAMDEAAVSVQPWASGSFTLVHKLQDCCGNYGQVDLMTSSLHGGRHVAVKRMPNDWVADDARDFRAWHPAAAERPWFDLGILRELNRASFPYANQLLGIFRDTETTYVVTSLATEGDLFSWRAKDLPPGLEREAQLKPIMRQVFDAVRMLHDMGIAHRDLSLENILLTEGAGGEPQVRIIDFAMATLSRKCRDEARGKVVYRAPEMLLSADYDAFLTDAFALGVVLFSSAARHYPWQSTSGSCPWFRLASAQGLRGLVSERTLRRGGGEEVPLSHVFSGELVDLMEGLLQLDPSKRTCLGQAAFAQQNGQVAFATRSVWDMAWVRESPPLPEKPADGHQFQSLDEVLTSDASTVDVGAAWSPRVASLPSLGNLLL